VPSSAIEKPETELHFQFSYQNTQSGRRNVEILGCSRETPMLRDEQESAKLTGGKFHL
jgi:hypothetical protein